MQHEKFHQQTIESFCHAHHLYSDTIIQNCNFAEIKIPQFTFLFNVQAVVGGVSSQFVPGTSTSAWAKDPRNYNGVNLYRAS